MYRYLWNKRQDDIQEKGLTNVFDKLLNSFDGGYSDDNFRLNEYRK